jgi:hypothetical protein
MERVGTRLPSTAHLAHRWRIDELVPDFTLEDVWSLPAECGAEDFGALLELLARSDPAHAESAPTRFLWQLRDRLGSWFDLGRISTAAEGSEGRLPIPGTDEASLAERLPADLRGTAAGIAFASLPFEPLYLTDREFAAEVTNRTVHGVMHLGWVEAGEGRYQGQMAVYVKPRGIFGKAYMELIKPFRHWIVYPALMRQTERTWNARHASRTG